MRVLVVDDENANRTIVADIIRDQGHDVDVAASGDAAVEKLQRGSWDLLLSDIRMPGMDGVALLEAARRLHPQLTVILMTAYATVSSAVEAMKKGAFDYLQKPFGKDDLVAHVRRVAERTRLLRENRSLRASLGAREAPKILGESPVIVTMRNQIERVARSPSDVLVTGESGTGKELVARALHFEGAHAGGPFVAVNCAAIAEGLAESELFGHKKGAFTHATSDRAGRFEQADGGTLFLDEISAMPAVLQPKLLRVLQERVVERVGSGDTREVDVRVVAASNRNLREMVAQGAFREDLFHRLNVLEINVPTLRERRDDIAPLTRVFCERAATRCGLPAPTPTPELIAALERYDFPGNVRELEHLMERLVVLADSDVLQLEDLPPHIIQMSGAETTSGAPPAHAAMEGPWSPEALLGQGPISLTDVEERLLREAIRLSNGNLSEAARRLGISYKTMRYRARKFAIGPDAPD
ncbi:MAG: sigma-54-dependent Fis family transcriptional regulator [Candidatus Latescibacterota bacterium]|nr:MAG: sigma-54-dependent Fis family transcriptional regulator [Candidatus Latescibacterota bacterium]